MLKKPLSIKNVFLILIIFSLGLFVLSYRRNKSIVSESAIVNHTNLVKLDLQNVFFNLKDMESGIRGYLITKDLPFLKNFYKGEGIIGLSLARLDSITKDNPSQQKNLLGLHLLVNKKIGWMKSQINAEDTQKIVIQKVLGGRAIMDEMRIKINEMTGEENELLKIRSLALDKKTLETPTIALLLALLLILVYFVLYLKTMERLKLDIRKKTQELTDSLDLLEKNNFELGRVNKELESFTYISSHDLQEPLRKIQFFISKIETEEYQNFSKSVQYSLKRVKESAKRMQTFIQDLMAYSRTSIEGFKFENMDLREVLDEVKRDLKEDLNTKNATIEATELCKANIIPSQFRQLLYNLIGNSIKYANPLVPLHISIKGIILKGSKSKDDILSPEKNYCHFTVSDNGIGFDPIYKDRIFEVFKRLHGKNQYEGSGIGLSIVKKIVENHCGIITATGVLGLGASFEIIIPSL